MNKLQENAIREYLENNSEERLAICREINSYDGSMDFCETYDLEELCGCNDAYEIVRAIIYGNVTSIQDNVKYNGYGNLETVSEYDLEKESSDYINDIIDFIDRKGTSYISDSEIDDILDNDDYKYTCPICNETFEDEYEMQECFNECNKCDK